MALDALAGATYANAVATDVQDSRRIATEILDRLWNVGGGETDARTLMQNRRLSGVRRGRARGPRRQHGAGVGGTRLPFLRDARGGRAGRRRRLNARPSGRPSPARRRGGLVRRRAGRRREHRDARDAQRVRAPCRHTARRRRLSRLAARLRRHRSGREARPPHSAHHREPTGERRSDLRIRQASWLAPAFRTAARASSPTSFTSPLRLSVERP